MKQQRQSSFEFFRILAMFAIVLFHSQQDGLLQVYPTWNKHELLNIPQMFTTYELHIFGNWGVVLFIMISGYFSITSQYNLRKQYKKIILLLSKLFFYTYIIKLIFVNYLHLFSWNPKTLTDYIYMPFNDYWFIKIYILLLLFIPFLNIGLNSLTKKQMESLIITMFIISTVLPIIFSGFYDERNYAELFYFVMYYSCGGYLRKYSICKDNNKERKIGIYLFIVGFILVTVFTIILMIMAKNTNNIMYLDSIQNIHRQISFMIAMMTFGTMLFIKNWNLKYSKIINTISSTTLGIYLIHGNFMLENLIWYDWVKMGDLINKSPIYIIIYSIIMSFIVFIVCSLIDYVRAVMCKLIINLWLKFKVLIIK